MCIVQLFLVRLESAIRATIISLFWSRRPQSKTLSLPGPGNERILFLLAVFPLLSQRQICRIETYNTIICLKESAVGVSENSSFHLLKSVFIKKCRNTPLSAPHDILIEISRPGLFINLNLTTWC